MVEMDMVQTEGSGVDPEQSQSPVHLEKIEVIINHLLIVFLRITMVENRVKAGIIVVVEVK
jgi:hypothetical protein